MTGIEMQQELQSFRRERNKQNSDLEPWQCSVCGTLLTTNRFLKMLKGVFTKYSGEDYDRLQPVRIEMYNFYHDLALDFLPFEAEESFRMLDLGCGTGRFIASVLDRHTESRCLAFDYSEKMLRYAAEKTEEQSGRVEFRQRDLNEGLPTGLGTFRIVSSFSAIHHLTHENKRRIFQQIFEVLEPGGWFFFIDPMSIHFENDVYRLCKQRDERRRRERYELAGLDWAEEKRVVGMTSQVGQDSPERDRIAPLASQLDWLREAGFKSVDHIWHFWMEHFVIARK